MCVSSCVGRAQKQTHTRSTEPNSHQSLTHTNTDETKKVIHKCFRSWACLTGKSIIIPVMSIQLIMYLCPLFFLGRSYENLIFCIQSPTIITADGLPPIFLNTAFFCRKKAVFVWSNCPPRIPGHGL